VRPIGALLGGLAVAAASPAFAQSNVTIYGLIDMYAQVGRGDSTVYAVESGGKSGSRLGFKGSEDLGDGLSAVFVLEMGIAADTGLLTQGGLAFGRQSYVGFVGPFGQGSVGRQYTPQYTAIDESDPFGTAGGSAQASGIVTVLATRADNSFFYRSPALGPGVTVSVLGGLGQQVEGNINSAYIKYSANNLDVGLGYAHHNPVPSSGGDSASALVLTGGYDFGSFKLQGGMQAVKNASRLPATDDDRTEFYAGVHVPFGSDKLTVGAGTGKVDGVGGTTATQLSVGYVHVFSKLTDVYGIYSYIKNGDATAHTPNGGSGAGPAVSAGNDAQALMLGLRVRF
jgi:predicted porin